MHWTLASDLQAVTPEGLVALQNAFANYQFYTIKIGDLVCRSCCRVASTKPAASPRTANSVLSPSREVLDLIATSPVAAEATGVALQNGPVLSAASFSELTASHPWSSRRPDDVLLELQRTNSCTCARFK